MDAAILDLQSHMNLKRNEIIVILTTQIINLTFPLNAACVAT